MPGSKLLAAALSAALLIAGLAFNGNSNSVAAGEVSNLTARQLNGLFPGEFRVVVRGFLKLHITASEGGAIFAQQVGKSDTGRWEIRADQLCIKFSKWLKGRTRCSRVSKKAGWYETTDVAFKKIGDLALARQ